jgi:hypothetical protein
MTYEQFDDLKQLVQTSAAQTEKHLSDKIKSLRREMTEGFVAVQKEMIEGFAGVGGAITSLNNAVDDNEQKLTKLKPYIV